MNKSKALKAIDQAYYRLAACCEHTNEWDRYLALIDQEEKQHRKFKPAGLSCGLTFGQARRLFAVKEVFDRFIPNESGTIWTPTAKDYFYVKGSVFGACVIADKCEEQILKEFKKPEMLDWLKSVDYCELNKYPKRQSA